MRPAETARLALRLAATPDGRGRTLLLALGTAVGTWALMTTGDVAVLFVSVYADGTDLDSGIGAALLVSPRVVPFMLLIGVPLFTFAYQVMLVGERSQQRRRELLRLAGATRAQVDAALGGATAAVVGAVAVVTVVVYDVLRWVLRPWAAEPRTVGPVYLDLRMLLGYGESDLVPGPGFSAAVALFTCVVGLALALVHARTVGRAPTHDAHPVRWAVPAALVMAVGVLVVVARSGRPWWWDVAAALPFAGVLFVLGPALALPLVRRTGQVVGARTGDAAVMLAARRAAARPGEPARGASSVACVAAVWSVLALGRFDARSERWDWLGDLGQLPLLLALAGVVALLLGAASVALAQAERVLDRTRGHAALVAAGTPVAVLRRSLAVEALLTTVPTTAVVVAVTWCTDLALTLVGAHGWGRLLGTTGWLAAVLVAVAVVPVVASTAVWPVLDRALRPVHLRTA